MATPREKVEGHLLPILVQLLGMQRMAKLVVSQGTKQLGNERATWLAGLMADQDRTMMVSAWRETMAFNSRPGLGEIACPTASPDPNWSLSMAPTTPSSGHTPTNSFASPTNSSGHDRAAPDAR